MGPRRAHKRCRDGTLLAPHANLPLVGLHSHDPHLGAELLTPAGVPVA